MTHFETLQVHLELAGANHVPASELARFEHSFETGLATSTTPRRPTQPPSGATSFPKGELWRPAGMLSSQQVAPRRRRRRFEVRMREACS
jgi:hypothetical protein